MQAGRRVVRRALRVVIAGGGVAALEAALALRVLAEERVDVTLLAPSSQFSYRPLAVAEPFSPGAKATLPLETIASDTGASLSSGALEGADTDRREVWTTGGDAIPYDVLLVATGAKAGDSIPGATTFWAGPDGGAFSTLLDQLRGGTLRGLVFAVPPGTAWPLPLYELALLTASDLVARGVEADLTLVTPEEVPLALVGGETSSTVTRLLAERGVELVEQRHAVAVVEGYLVVAPDDRVPADAVVTLPVLTGPRLRGLPHDRHGFLPTDASCRVDGLADVFAAGDVTVFPVKHGGIAAQQADAAAEEIAALAGAPVKPAAFRPVLHGRLLTGGPPLYFRAEIHGGAGGSTVSEEPLWWPPGKIFGRYLGPYLAQHAEAIAQA